MARTDIKPVRSRRAITPPVLDDDIMLVRSRRAEPLTPGAQSLAKLLDTGAYSDLTIICGKDRYKVHKAIVCPRSPFFQAAISGKFKEAMTSEINLPEDDPVVVHMMVQFLYLDEYTPPKPHDPEADTVLPSTEHDDQSKKRKNDYGSTSVAAKRTKRIKSPESVIPQFSSSSELEAPPDIVPLKKLESLKRKPMGTPTNLCLHTKVYELGERYGLQDLKEHAVKKFRSEARYHNHREEFQLAVYNAYTSTIDQDRSLRDAVVDVVAKNVDLLEKDSFQKVVKDTELGFDLLMHITLEDRKKLTPSVSRLVRSK